MTYGVQFSGHKETTDASEQERFLDKVETAAAAATTAFKESLGDDASTLTYASLTSDRGSKNLLT